MRREGRRCGCVDSEGRHYDCAKADNSSPRVCRSCRRLTSSRSRSMSLRLSGLGRYPTTWLPIRSLRSCWALTGVQHQSRVRLESSFPRFRLDLTAFLPSFRDVNRRRTPLLRTPTSSRRTCDTTTDHRTRRSRGTVDYHRRDRRRLLLVVSSRSSHRLPRLVLWTSRADPTERCRRVGRSTDREGGGVDRRRGGGSGRASGPDRSAGKGRRGTSDEWRTSDRGEASRAHHSSTVRRLRRRRSGRDTGASCFSTLLLFLANVE